MVPPSWKSENGLVLDIELLFSNLGMLKRLVSSESAGNTTKVGLNERLSLTENCLGQKGVYAYHLNACCLCNTNSS